MLKTEVTRPRPVLVRGDHVLMQYVAIVTALIVLAACFAGAFGWLDLLI